MNSSGIGIGMELGRIHYGAFEHAVKLVTFSSGSTSPHPAGSSGTTTKKRPHKWGTANAANLGQTLQTDDANTTSSHISPPAVGDIPRMVGYQSR